MLLFEREVLGLEMDYFSGGDFKKKLGISEAGATETGQVRTTAGAQVVDAKVLRSCGRNAVAVSAIVLSPPINRRIVAIMGAAAGPMCVWEGAESKACRNAETVHTWCMCQIQGGFAASLLEVFATLTDLSAQRAGGFLDFDGAPQDDLRDLRTGEDELADLHGRLCLSLAACRLRRCFAKLQGWPGKC